ncbi:MAG: cyclic nucleotide-binding domain-containing protein [Deltaproteobacteria bacterium]|nr:cyclic nucleotide-binding domain-containing protein [Deltaproteobacteria bacterium]
MDRKRLDALHRDWEKAIEKDRHADAVKALVELEKLDLDEPRWSQRLGEAYRRLGKTKDAEEAFARAAERYMTKGFLPRAIAMAKLVSSLNPAHGDLLARLEAKSAPAPARIAPPPLPLKPVPLARAHDSSADEVRFEDVNGPPSIDFMLQDVSGSGSIEIEVTEGSEFIVLSQRDVIPDPSEVTGLAPTRGPAQPKGPPPLPAAATAPTAEPSMDRMATMASFRLFAGLSREALLALSSKAEVAEFVPSAMVVMRNERAFALYAIVDGSARVLVPGSPEIRLGEGDVFGEGCLLDEGERQADVRAETAMMTLRIAKDDLDRVTAEHAEVGDALFQLLARRLVMNLMHSSPLFTAFEPKVRLDLAQLFEVRRAEKGTVLAEQGKRSDGLYVLLSGHLEAKGAGIDGVTRVARGSAFGHSSLLGAMPADTTVRAATEAVLLRLPSAKFSALAASYPPVLAHLAATADEPLRASLLPE